MVGGGTQLALVTILYILSKRVMGCQLPMCEWSLNFGMSIISPLQRYGNMLPCSKMPLKTSKNASAMRGVMF